MECGENEGRESSSPINRFLFAYFLQRICRAEELEGTEHQIRVARVIQADLWQVDCSDVSRTGDRKLLHTQRGIEAGTVCELDEFFPGGPIVRALDGPALRARPIERSIMDRHRVARWLDLESLEVKAKSLAALSFD
jgi:hypothetical protein